MAEEPPPASEPVTVDTPALETPDPEPVIEETPPNSLPVQDVIEEPISAPVVMEVPSQGPEPTPTPEPIAVFIMTRKQLEHLVRANSDLLGRRCRAHNRNMKITDDYSGKLEIWAREGKAVRLPKLTNLPRFGHRRFNSYEELNAWKQSLMDELLKRGGAQWTR